MDKRNFNLEPLQSVRFSASDFGSDNRFDIEVIPYFSPEIKLFLVNNYIEDAFAGDDPVLSTQTAENKLIFGIIKLNTNINIPTEQNEELENKISAVFTSGLWEKIKSTIINYGELREEINKAVILTNAKNSSINAVLNNIKDFIKENLSEEKIKTISFQIKEQMDELSKVYPNIKEDTVSNGVEEQPKPKRTRKSKNS